MHLLGDPYARRPVASLPARPDIAQENYAAIAPPKDAFGMSLEGNELPRKVFQTMNGLRGLAALVVLMYHRPEWYGAFSLGKGFLAVDLFFVLSGFVIAYSYEEKLSKGMNVRTFIALRLIRLYPLYMLGTLCGVGALLSSYLSNGHITEKNSIGLISVPFAFLMLPTPNLYDKLAALYPLNIPAWSLLFEIIVNVLYAVSWRWWKPKLLISAMAVMGATILMHPGYADSGWNWDSFGFGLLRVLYSFPAGVLIYRLYSKNALRMSSVNSIAILAAFLMMLMAPWRWDARFCELLGFPLLVAAAAKSEPSAAFRPLFSTLGAASYALYSIHAPLMIFIKAALGKFGADSHPHLIGAVFLAAILPATLVIDRWFDAPVRKRLNAVFTRRPATRSLPVNNPI